ncbi:dihydrodipicolinate synthase family protein [Rhodococcus sp. ACPA4]|uniref:dihydrodipicolinate synthase family protein n=1 Tax=unclassified Rhodococcus (in: high G+C Gram-positive bacteria) TaxID=192944 RepID=UPI000BB10D0F|nr:MULTISPECIES: dihydrodipicolinate synthase family protein [unclassified Rhodococcus (in: high G+C Gram-positive bacteria)]NRI65371.1 dihydrodipicolinate synthase family protein [Rhodococcus sp. MS16]PBC37376.1 dihydrodipicolinate synthase family protein [Rhodococcus sp. ACPA4]RZL24722.1 MAG: dihydrodipicolinate synthase family protein [Rhodococcus sp. (in: high G+C Gram-positive bacteria)]
MNRNTVGWTGYIPAITTPFTRDGELDLASLSQQMGWLAEQQMHGVILAGTSGEWFSMQAEERKALFMEGGKHRSDDLVVIGACNAFTPQEAITHARAAENAGLDGILLTPPPYIVPNRREIVKFYTDVSDATDLPICVYNWPRGCIVDLDTDTLTELAEIENVVAVKNSTGNFASFLTSMYALEGSVRYFGLPTNALGADLAMLGHGDGLMGSGGVLGSDHPNFWRAIAAGDRTRALELGARDRVIMDSWFTPDYGVRFGNQQAIMKTALRLQGVPAGYVRDPLLELTPDEVTIIATTLESLGIETKPLT